MGREARGAVRIGQVRGEARILLETDELIFRGEVKGRVAFRAITTIEAGPGGLRLAWAEGDATVAVPESEAARWAERITNPPGLLDKLGVKDGATAAVLDPEGLLAGDGAFAAELAARGVNVVGAGPADVVIWALDRAAELDRIPGLADWIRPAGALWAVWPKGRRELNENHIRDAAIGAGLVDVKVARFSATLSALKLVVPKAQRGRVDGHT